MEKEFKTIANIIGNTNGQVVELNDGCYLYLSYDIINDIVCNNRYVYDSIFNKGVNTSEPIVEATKKDANDMSKRIKELESQLNTSNDFISCYKNDIKKLKDTINNKEATIAQYVRDIECLNERIESLEDHLRDHVKHTDILKNIVDSDKEAIDKYIRDFNCLNNHINNVKNNINKYIETTDKINNNFKNDIIEVINKEFESKFAKDVESFNWDEHDDSKYL